MNGGGGAVGPWFQGHDHPHPGPFWKAPGASTFPGSWMLPQDWGSVPLLPTSQHWRQGVCKAMCLFFPPRSPF